MSSISQRLLARINLYLQSSLKHITELISGNKSYKRGGRCRQVSLYCRVCVCVHARFLCWLVSCFVWCIYMVHTVRHYDDVIISLMASQITSLTIVYSTSYSGVDQRKHQSSASLAFVRGIHRGPVNSPHKRSVMRKMFPFDDVINNHLCDLGLSCSLCCRVNVLGWSISLMCCHIYL